MGFTGGQGHRTRIFLTQQMGGSIDITSDGDFFWFGQRFGSPTENLNKGNAPFAGRALNFCIDTTSNGLDVGSVNGWVFRVEGADQNMTLNVFEGAGTGTFSVSVDGSLDTFGQFDLLNMHKFSDSVGSMNVRGTGWGGVID